MGVIGVLLGVVMDILSHYGLNPVNWGGIGEWCGVYVTSRYLYRVYMGRWRMLTFYIMQLGGVWGAVRSWRGHLEPPWPRTDQLG